LKQFVSIFFVFVILICNSGLAIITHYCGGKAVLSDWSIVDKNLSCGMIVDVQNASSNNCQNKEEGISEASCCDNQIVNLDCDDEFAAQNWQFKSDVHAIVPLGIEYVSLLYNFPVLSTNQKANPPPLLKHNYTLLFQSFLI